MIQKKERKRAPRALKALSQDDTDDLKKKKRKKNIGGKADIPGTCIVIIGDWAANPCGSGLTRRRRDGKRVRGWTPKSFFQRCIGCRRREYTRRSRVFVTGKPAKAFPPPPAHKSKLEWHL